MSSAEKRSGIDGDDDGIEDLRELGLELGATESNAMESLSLDAVEVGGVRQAQERGNTEILVEGNGKDKNGSPDIYDGSNDGASTNSSSHYPGQDFGIESDTDGLREESSRGNEGHESIEIRVLDDSDNRHADDGSDVSVDKHGNEVSLIEHKDSKEEESEKESEEESEEESGEDCRSDYSDILSRSEINNPRFVRWPIEYPQIADEKMKCQNETNTATAEVLNPNLCKFCRVFFDDWSSVSDFFSKSDSYRVLFAAHCGTMSDFKVSASSGCYLCALFLGIIYIDRDNSDSRAHKAGNNLPLDRLKPHRMKLQPNGDHSGDNHRERENVWNISLDFWIFDDGIRSTITAYAIMILDDILDSGSWKRECYTSTNLGQNSQDELRLGCTEESAALAQAWLQECSSSHSSCKQREEASVLPTRLIKIDCQEIRLCVSADENCSQYATLSHCWGKAEVLRLQKDNLQAFLERIPYDNLCKTFRDAIDIARVLGFSWLWIDSLCIIQGDSEDWSKEASQMATVYGLSSLNIAATAAPDGTIGCLFERDLKYTEIHKAEVKINHQKQVYKIADYNLYRQNIANAALTRRAWAVQERILAPRTLHFTKSQLFWECRTNQACETFVDTLPEAICDDYFYLPKQELQSWSKIIDIYTWCSLTNEGDRLIAIGGVARQLQKKSGDKYFAGLWQARLKEQMCWYTDKFVTKIPRENSWRAPSWSWAAVKHRVVIHDDATVLSEAYIDVIEVNITLEDVDNPFGDVKSGVLTLRSRSMISCERKSPLHRFTRMTVGKISIGHTYSNWDHEDCGSKGYCNSILILPIGILEDVGTNSNFSRIDGLLLRPTDQKNGQYERLGHFTILKGNADYELIRRAMNLAQDEQFEELGLLENGGALPSEKDYVSTDVDEDGITWYTISVI